MFLLVAHQIVCTTNMRNIFTIFGHFSGSTYMRRSKKCDASSPHETNREKNILFHRLRNVWNEFVLGVHTYLALSTKRLVMWRAIEYALKKNENRKMTENECATSWLRVEHGI